MAVLRRWFEPPQPYILNPHEQDAAGPLGRWNLYIGGANQQVPGYINLDLFATPGVDVRADAHALPFGDAIFQRVECDAVLEHVVDPVRIMSEIQRVLLPGGMVHVVVPFCHPFHEYPRDFRRFTPDGLAQLAGELEVVDTGWRTGPAATWLTFTLDFIKMLLPWRWWRVLAHGVFGWLLWPVRYLDLWLLSSPYAVRLGNHCYAWFRKPDNSSASS